MKTIASVAIAAVIAATSLTTTIAPASAGSFKFGVHHYSGGHHHGSHHRNRHYRHRHNSGPGAAIAAGAILGLAFGALSTPSYYYPPTYPRQRYPAYYPYAAGPGMNSQHVSFCYSRYKSYNANTNTWLGYDGYVHQCVSPY